MKDVQALELSWCEVCSIVTNEIEVILGLRVPCKSNVVVGSFWDVTFIGHRLSLVQLCQLLQETQATSEDWEDALPDEGEVDVGGIGIVLAENLISRHLKLTWEHHLITEDSLWLVGVAKSEDQEPSAGAAAQRSFR